MGFAAAYSASWLIRLAIIIRNGLHTATLTSSPTSTADGMIHVSIPTTLKWKAGQHYFVRFFTKDAHMLTSHPFTVASAPEDGVMEFIIKPAGGMTASLARMIERIGGEGKDERQARQQVKVVVDGPYGGARTEVGRYDRVLLIAGGSSTSPDAHMADVARDRYPACADGIQVSRSYLAHFVT